ncbi:MAG TPA: glycosyltransferase family 39 protein [Kofleriaceae bacterium]|nr:glycosyltransferase family 39 protein [Kofleriaceae bacterium]
MERPSRWIVLVEAALVFTLLAAGLSVRARIASDWKFIGGDSLGYIKLANELRRAHRYALGPGEPPYYVRLPLYPMFLAVTQDAAESGRRAPASQRWVDVVVTGLLVHLLARRAAGRVAALLALALAMFCPLTAIFPAAVMTETLALALTTATVALLCAGERRPRLRYLAAGAVAGLGVLARPDSLLLGAAFVPALLLHDATFRVRAALAGLAFAGFALVYGPWPVRNLARFGHAYPVGTYASWHNEPLQHVDGYRHWVATWAKDGVPVGLSYCFYEPSCDQGINWYPLLAFDPGERDTVTKLLAQRRVTGIDATLDAGFEALASARRARRPLRHHVTLPLRRAFWLWVNPHNDLVFDPKYRPWRDVFDVVVPKYRGGMIAFGLFTLAGAVLLACRRERRRVALVLATAIVARILVLAYAYLMEPRYLLEVLPLAFVLAAAAPVEATRRVAQLARFVRRRRWQASCKGPAMEVCAHGPKPDDPAA